MINLYLLVRAFTKEAVAQALEDVSQHFKGNTLPLGIPKPDDFPFPESSYQLDHQISDTPPLLLPQADPYSLESNSCYLFYRHHESIPIVGTTDAESLLSFVGWVVNPSDISSIYKLP